MPLPQLEISGGQPRNIPEVRSVQPQIDDAFGALGRGVSSLAAGISDIGGTLQHERVADYNAAETIKNREEQEERRQAAAARRSADDLYGEYSTHISGLAHGSVAPDGSSVPGWDSLKHDSLETPEGGAAKRLAKAQQEFLSTEKYANLSPRAKRLFDARAQAAYAGFSEEAVKVDARNTIDLRKLKDQANLSASLSAADAVPLDDDASWLRTAGKAAADNAVMKMGTEILNPEDLYTGGTSPDATRLRFRGGEAMRAIYTADEKLTRDTLSAARAARMMNAAKSETDLDRQDSFLRLAEGFAKTHVTDEKTLAAVTTESEAVRADALRKEKLIALDALASGNPYEPAGNARRDAALKWAAPKIETAKRREASHAATELGRAMRANAAFLSSSLEAGVWIRPDGEIEPLDLARRRQTALDALDKGLIDIPHYTAIRAKLDAVETDGRQADYEQVSADVARAVAPDVKTVFRNGVVELSEKEKNPDRTVLKYTAEERGTVKQPVLKGQLTTRGGIPAHTFAETGEFKNVEVVNRTKKELLAKDIPQLVTLLMDAKRTQGMTVWRDLDGNAVKRPAKADYDAYREFLLADFADRQTALDLDAKAAKARDAISGARNSFRADEARVLRSASARPGLPTASPAANDEEDADPLWP